MAMKKVYVARDGAEAQFVCDLLLQEGIPAVVLGEQLHGLGGAIPFASAQPVVCVEDTDVSEARRITAGVSNRLARPVKEGKPWKCPACGEHHEAQFSECWNCQAAKPEDGAEPPALPDAPADVTTERELPCASCGYDLRGLPLAHPCPECGYPVVGSVLEVLSRPDVDMPDSLDALIRGPFEAVGRAAGYPMDAMLIVCHAWLRSHLRGGVLAKTVRAGELCDAVRACAVRQLGGWDEARALFRQWGIVDSEQVGQIGEALRSAGLLPSTMAVGPGAIRGWFTLDDLFPPGV